MAEIRHSIQIAAKPETIYPLVATAQGFRRWWAADIAEFDGAAELGFFKRTTVYRLKLKVDQPPTEAEWLCETGQDGRGTHLSFSLEAQVSATVLRFTHSGWASETDYFVSCNTTWGELMFRLKAAAEGKSRGPLFLPDALAY